MNCTCINGLNRRLRFVNFPCKYVEHPNPKNPLERPRDVNIIPKLLKELPGIFNWAYRGYKLLRTVNYFTDNPDQQSMVKQFETVSNPVAVFCEDMAYNGNVTREAVYSNYRQWCDQTGHKPLSRERFLPKFREAMGEQIVEDKNGSLGGTKCRYFVIKPAEFAC